MSTVHRFLRAALISVTVGASLAMAGCGTPGAPMPPSLNLPDAVANLAATRIGNQVSLSWTMPKKNTDKLLLKDNLTVRICRKEAAGACIAAGTELSVAPGAAGAFTESLPPALATGTPRPLSYFVELKNRNGRSAGLSNGAVILAGEAPQPVAGLAAEVRKQGVVLRWAALNTTIQDTTAQKSESAVAVRLHRTLLTPPPARQQQDLLTPPPEPLEQNLLIESGAQAGRALDKDIRFGKTYEYRAQRVARITVDGRTLELVGELSAPVRVAAVDVFPPAVPTSLAAVATAAENGVEAAIDLSWQPGTEADLAGYAVYRREGDGAWQRISPAQPLVPPAFHDAHVQPGHSYRYVVTAIDQSGHQSARSAEAEETVPNP